MSGARSSRSVFVGNIPYDATEEQLVEVFQDIGPVVSFRLVFDRDTGKPKGYGFCEFRDSETAMSAIRNLDGYEFNGRSLRIDFAENEKQHLLQSTASSVPTSNSQQPLQQPQPQPQQQQQTQRAAASSTPETINNILESMTPQALYDMVAAMKQFIQQSPDLARQYLIQNPPLAYALLQAQANLGMITATTLQNFLLKAQSNSGLLASGNVPVNLQQQQQQQQQQQPHLGISPVYGGGIGPVSFPQVSSPSLASTLPYGNMFPPSGGGNISNPYQIPATGNLIGMNQMKMPGSISATTTTSTPTTSSSNTLIQQQVPMPPQMPMVDGAQLVQQLLSFTPEQIEQFPPEQRQLALQLRQQILSYQQQPQPLLSSQTRAQQQQQQPRQFA